jgi:hypothetical protein
MPRPHSILTDGDDPDIRDTSGTGVIGPGAMSGSGVGVDGCGMGASGSGSTYLPPYLSVVPAQ